MEANAITPEIKDRLKLLLDLQTTVSAGQLVLLGLNQIKATLGDEWPRYRDRIYTQMEKVFDDTLLPREVYLRVEEDKYVVVFYDRDQAAAQILCEKIIGTVYETFLGKPKESGITIDSVVMALDPETIARTMGIDLSDRSQRIPAEGKAPDAPPPGAGRRRLPQQDGRFGSISYIPVWDVAHRLIYAYIPTIFTISGRRRLSGYAALGDQNDRNLVRALDTRRYTDAVQSLQDIKGSGSNIICIVPVSFLTLSSTATARDYYRLCSAAEGKVRHQLIFQLSQITSGTPLWRAYEIVAMLKQWGRGVFLSIDGNWRDYHLLNELPIMGVSFNMERDMRAMDRIKHDIEAVAAITRKRRLLLAVSGVHTLEYARMVVDAGARFVSGQYLVSTVTKPLPAFSMDWLDLSDLVLPKAMAGGI